MIVGCICVAIVVYLLYRILKNKAMNDGDTYLTHIISFKTHGFNNSNVLRTMRQLTKDYDFEIVRVDFDSITSKIMIKSKGRDHMKIFEDFTLLCENKIYAVSYK